MDKKLQDGIIETIKCYGCKLSHNISDTVHCYYNDYKKYGVTIDTKSCIVNIFNTIGTISYLEEEHVSLNAICAVLSNI